MNNFGVLKSKMLTKLTESYSNKNKKQVKNILNVIKDNKDFKEMYLFYEEIENMEISIPGNAELYVESIEPLLIEKTKSIKNVCKDVTKIVGSVQYEKNELYECLDVLSENSNLNNASQKLNARKKLIEHLKAKKQTNQVENPSTVVVNESLLYAVLTNNFNTLFENSLNEGQKKEFQEIMKISENELKSKITELKENILNKIESLLSESSDSNFTNKLENVKNEVSNTSVTKYNLFKLKELRNGLD